ncbi:MAG: YgjV family protein [Gemmatimonadetes bacterium]|nr:YgjV family protein [Gemmatimonadota bacterium]
MTDVVGWAATLVFVSSYFFARPESLRRVQIAGAILWIAYGVLLSAPPVIAANVMLIVAAAWTIHRARRSIKDGPAQPVS